MLFRKEFAKKDMRHVARYKWTEIKEDPTTQTLVSFEKQLKKIAKQAHSDGADVYEDVPSSKTANHFTTISDHCETRGQQSRRIKKLPDPQIQISVPAGNAATYLRLPANQSDMRYQYKPRIQTIRPKLLQDREQKIWRNLLLLRETRPQ